jgi:ABC superfamily ATP binding cassette transporter-associated protein
MNLEQGNQIEYDIYLKGLTEETIRKMSADLGEPERMLNHRLQSLEIFKKMAMPNFGPDISDLDFDNLVYYAKPKT